MRLELKALAIKVSQYQDYLSSHLEAPKNRTSCFDSHFAVHYLSQMAEKKVTCKAQVDFLRSQILKLLEEDSLEFKSVISLKHRKKLKAFKRSILLEKHLFR
jgi:hypothetical protein